MLSRLAIALTAAAALAGGVIATAAPSQAQGFSITIGSGNDYYRPAGGHHGWGHPHHGYGPRGYGRPHHYGHPGWGHGGGHGGGYGRRCWRQPVDVWNGWGYERRFQRVCR